MTCRELTEFLLDYLSGSLPEAECAAFETHLRECPPCEAYLQTYQATVHLIKVVFRGPEIEPDALPEPLVRAILNARPSRDR
jgi:anti-sigma factor RsiW